MYQYIRSKINFSLVNMSMHGLSKTLQLKLVRNDAMHACYALLSETCFLKHRLIFKSVLILKLAEIAFNNT